MSDHTPSPLFTVGIPAYNRPDLTRETLQSALNQTFQDYEILVVDDTPNDSVGSVVRSFNSNKLHYTKHEPPIGVVRKLNEIVRLARGQWLVILGDDDLFEPRFLETMARRLGDRPDAALIRTRYHFIDTRGQSLGLDLAEPSEVSSPEAFLSRVFLPPQHATVMNITGFVFPAASMRQIGGFTEFNRGLFTDRLAYAQLGSLGPCLYEKEPLIRLRINPIAISRTFDHDVEALLDTCRLMNRSVDRIFFDLKSKTTEPSKLNLLKRGHEEARAHVRRQIFSEANMILTPLMKNISDPSAPSRVLGILSGLSEWGPVPYAAWYRFLLKLPAPARLLLFSAMRRLSHLTWRAQLGRRNNVLP